MRDERMDNFRGIMMFLVVFGHLIGAFTLSGYAYRVIYIFHMPAFIFLSGCYSKWSKRAFLNLAVLYVLTQIADFFFYRAAFPQWTAELTLRFSEPYIFGWYLMSLMWYMLLSPLFDSGSRRVRIAALIGALALAVAVGFDSNISYLLSLSRTLVFLPFFILGRYVSRWKRGGGELSEKGRLILAVSCGAVAVLSLLWAYLHPLAYSFLYGAEPYANYRMGLLPAAGTRLFYLLCAAAWIALFMLFTPRKTVPILTRVGRNTLPVYLLHGYVVALIFKFGVFSYGKAANYLLAAAVAAVLCAALGNKYLSKILRLPKKTEEVK